MKIWIDKRKLTKESLNVEENYKNLVNPVKLELMLAMNKEIEQ